MYMHYLSDSLKQKVNWWVAALVILIVALAAAWAISVRAANGTSNFKKWGGRITYYEPGCTFDPLTARCDNCQLCSSQYGAACAGMEEINFKPALGSDSIFVCPTKGFKYTPLGITPQIGGQLLGFGINEAAPLQIGLSPK
jgi:hypothetical protein